MSSKVRLGLGCVGCFVITLLVLTLGFQLPVVSSAVKSVIAAAFVGAGLNYYGYFPKEP